MLPNKIKRKEDHNILIPNINYNIPPLIPDLYCKILNLLLSRQYAELFHQVYEIVRDGGAPKGGT